MSKVLFIGRKTDPHIIGLQKELQRINQESVILDEFSFLESFQIDFPTNKVKINTKSGNFESSDIISVWNSSALRLKINEKLIKESQEFVKNEWGEGILSLWNSIDAVWVNDPTSISLWGNRLKQLKLANQLGLKIPNTLITNNPKVLKDFFILCKGEIVAKTLNSSVGLPDGKMIFTTKITETHMQKYDDLRNAPSMFQEYIPKKTEYRITIIGDTIHSVEIDSQKSEKTKDDWRNYDDFQKTPYIRKQLPEEISSKLLLLMKKMNLKFVTADLICTPNNEYYFLEINTNGRWWWIQELTKAPIAKDIAKFLANPY